MKRVSEYEINSWIELNKQHSIEAISKIAGRDDKTITKWLKKIGHKIEKHHPLLFTENEFKEIYTDYVSNDNTTLKSISEKYNVSLSYLDSTFTRFGFKKKSLRTIRHLPVNDNFFSIIDTEIKAYLLGFFAADGHIEYRKSNDNYALRISVNKKDLYVLELFKEYVGNDLKSIKFKNNSNMASITIHSKTIGTDLLSYGYDNRKTYTSNKLPTIESGMMPHFIRGFIDGDGYVGFNKQKVGVNRVLQIVAYKEDILNEILEKFPPFPGKIQRLHKQNITMKVMGKVAHFKECASVSICDRKSLRIIYEYLYTNANFFFQRKHNKFLQIIQ